MDKLRAIAKMAGAAAVVFLMSVSQAYGQCAMCRAALAAAADGAPSASSFNLAVLVLLVPPVAIFVGIFAVGYKYRHSGDNSSNNVDESDT